MNAPRLVYDVLHTNMASNMIARTAKVGLVGIQQLTLTLRRSRSLLPNSLRLTSDVRVSKDDQFDPLLLQVLACPLSKKPLRYDEKRNELVCDEFGVAYPIVEGIPNLNPQEGRVFSSPDQDGREPSHSTTA